jgi:hypothetical protein
MIYGITYGDENMRRSATVCKLSMLKNGFDAVDIVDESKIDPLFALFNKDIFTGKRGAGCYWLFKPYFIYLAMMQLKDNDLLVYSDAGVEWATSVNEIVSRMDQDMFLFTNTHPNHHWTKRFTLDTMMPDWRHNRNADTPWPQVQASVIFIKVCQNTRDFIKRWLLWCQMPGIIDDSKGPNHEYSYFQDHRHDQSILSVLATQAGYRLHWWPTAYAEHIRVPGDTYPVLFNHHRKRDPGKGEGVNPEW